MGETKDFLLEIGCEEMPSAPLTGAVRQLPKLMADGLDEVGLAHGELRVISSPRRLAVLVKDVPTSTEALHEVKRGPAADIAFDADGNPTKAAEGFARKLGVEASDLVRRQDSDGREYVFAEKSIPSQPAMPLLTKVSHDVIAGIQWPNYRSQRWGSEHETFVRPIRWICALLGSDVVPVSYADVSASNTTRGHRVLAPGEHVVPTPADYELVLERAFVLDAARRAELIREQAAKVETERGAVRVDMPERIFNEVVNLCEWPTSLVGSFDEEFLAVPHEIISESMLSNQRYFPIYDAEGRLTRDFVVVSNASPSCAATVVDGNERVVRARLDDAKFFYEEDLKVPMDEFVDRLDKVVFQVKLGTVRQKVARMEALAPAVAQAAAGEASEELLAEVRRAAHLAKADLVSQTVVEFTNQQGVMGSYFAKAAGEPEDVCVAIREHYRPRFAGDELPSNLVGAAVAVADKLDTICGIFAIDEPPTGSSDPFALRRAAIGTISILRTLPSVHLKPLIRLALESYSKQGLVFDEEKVAAAVEAFFLARLAAIAREEKVSADTIAAVSAVGVIDPDEFLLRARALDRARSESPELFEDLATAYARASHLAKPELGTAVDESLAGEAETRLVAAVAAGETSVSDAVARGDFDAAFAALASLRDPIDTFFTDVLVMDPDPLVRDNRLRILNRFSGVFGDIADIGALSKRK